MVLELDPECREALAGFGLAQLKLGQTEEARETFEEVLQRWPDCSASHAALAEILESSGDVRQAVCHLEFLLDQDPMDCGTRNKVGKACKKFGLVESALHHYRQAIAINPEFQWWFHRAPPSKKDKSFRGCIGTPPLATSTSSMTFGN